MTSEESTTAIHDKSTTKRATSAVLLCDKLTTDLAMAATDPAVPPSITSETAAMGRVVLTDTLRGASATTTKIMTSRGGSAAKIQLHSPQRPRSTPPNYPTLHCTPQPPPRCLPALPHGCTPLRQHSPHSPRCHRSTPRGSTPRTPPWWPAVPPQHSPHSTGAAVLPHPDPSACLLLRFINTSSQRSCAFSSATTTDPPPAQPTNHNLSCFFFNLSFNSFLGSLFFFIP